MKKLSYLFLASFIVLSCDKDPIDPVDPNPPTPVTGPKLIFKFQFDNTQERLDAFGNVSTVPTGHGAISPTFNAISGHVIELTPNASTAVGAGEMVYKGAETTIGGDNAIDFSQAKVVSAGEEFVSVPLSEVAAGTYEYCRVSITYQNYQIPFTFNGDDFDGTLASFVGFHQCLSPYTVCPDEDVVNENLLQGYWAFETHDETLPVTVPLRTGQAPGTTVPNPINSTSPIPAGSCLVTGQFANSGFTITGDETEDIVIILSLSTNKSFEWTEVGTEDGKYDPAAGEEVVDMGLRGLLPIVQ